MAILAALGTLVMLATLFTLYVWHNDAKMKAPPPNNLGTEAWSEKLIHETYDRISATPHLLAGKLPPKTGRRYIVVGGNAVKTHEGFGLLTSVRQREGTSRNLHLALTLLKRILRIATLCPKPSANHGRPVLSPAKQPKLTVFHTAAIIRFFERHPSLLPQSDGINLKGTQNVVDAAREVGASTLVYTSSGSVAVRRSRFWLWPWQKEPKYFMQIINDDDTILPKQHDEFFSNYAVSKLKAERAVRNADGSKSGNSVIRTGCVRPGNGIYGPGGDILVDRLLREKVNPTWVPTVMQSFIYVENCSLAHLCYEQCLNDLQADNKNPDIGGQAFNITDAGPTPTYGDIYTAVNILSKGAATFIYLSPTFILFVSHLVEWYYVARHLLVQSSLSVLGKLVPAIRGDIIFLQPSMFALTNVHLIFDDSRARAAPEKGGLGYNPLFNTLEGVCKVILEYEKNGGEVVDRAVAGHPEPTTLTFDPTMSEKGVVEVVEAVEKISNNLKVDAKNVWN